MSKKNLLEEGAVRRFMKLAGNEVLASDFLTEKTGKAGNMGRTDVANKATGRWLKEEEELEEDEEVMQEQPEDELDLEAEADVELPEEPGADLEPEAEAGEEECPAVEDFARDMLDAMKGVAKEHGVDMEVEEMPEPEEIDVGEMEPEEEGEGLELGGEEMGELGGEEELGDEEELEEATAPYKWGKKYGEKACLDANNERVHNSRCEKEQKAQQESLEFEEINYIDEDALMQEVYKRVTKRIIREKQTDDMANTLAEKISRRLGKKK